MVRWPSSTHLSFISRSRPPPHSVIYQRFANSVRDRCGVLSCNRRRRRVRFSGCRRRRRGGRSGDLRSLAEADDWCWIEMVKPERPEAWGATRRWTEGERRQKYQVRPCRASASPPSCQTSRRWCSHWSSPDRVYEDFTQLLKAALWIHRSRRRKSRKTHRRAAAAAQLINTTAASAAV